MEEGVGRRFLGCRHADSQLASDRDRVLRGDAGQTHRTGRRRHPGLRAGRTRTSVRAQLRLRPPPETQRSSALRLVQRVGGGGSRWNRNLQFVRPVLRRLWEREVQHEGNGERRTDMQYYHRIVVVALVSTPFPIPWGVRFQKKCLAAVHPSVQPQPLANRYGSFFRPSPPTATSNTRLSIRPQPWWCSP